MNKNTRPIAEWTDEEKYFQPAWVDAARERDYEATKDMTPEERVRYYNQGLAKLEQLRANRNGQSPEQAPEAACETHQIEHQEPQGASEADEERELHS